MINFSENDISKYFERVKSLAIDAYKGNEVEKSLRHIELAANIAYNFNYIYSDKQSEELLRKISSRIIKKSNPFIPQTNKYLFYDAFGWENRGLTQQYIRGLMSLNVEFLFIFENRHPIFSETILQELKAYGSKAEIFEINQKLNLVQQIVQLYEKIEEYAPSKALLHIAPWSVMAIATFYALPQIVKYNINLTDHAFWLGNECIDYNIEFRNYGCTVSMQKRGLRADQLLLLPYYPIVTKTKFEGFPTQVTENKVVIFSGGSYYKIYGENGFYFNIIKRLLEENPEALLLFAGGGDDRKMRYFIKTNKLQERILLLGHRSDINEVFESSDIYLGTYPFCGGLMSQYAAVHGKPILAYTDPKFPGNFIEDIVCHQQKVKITFTKLNDFYNYAHKLISSKEKREKTGNELSKCVITQEQFNKEFEQIISNNTSHRKFEIENINYEAFAKMYLEVENKYSNTFQTLIISKFRLKSIYLFPKVIIKSLPGFLIRRCKKLPGKFFLFIMNKLKK